MPPSNTEIRTRDGAWQPSVRFQDHFRGQQQRVVGSLEFLFRSSFPTMAIFHRIYWSA